MATKTLTVYPGPPFAHLLEQIVPAKGENLIMIKRALVIIQERELLKFNLK